MKTQKTGMLCVLLLWGICASLSPGQEGPYKIIESKNMKTQPQRGKEEKMDLNTASKEEMSAKKIPISAVRGIVSYRETTGGFESVMELKRIKGIGPAAYEKISAVFRVGTPVRKKRFNINRANETTLSYYGFTKKEIAALSAWIGKHGRIRNNLDLMEILSKPRYETYKELVVYDAVP
ncbi:MAG: helix-hairpin-helix domain-containing protein [Fusobacteriaceae bacterium]|jgi:competence protein ComEA|nr:helix-hairpin-helix domain-containing protein [Fusobacteriaceae bacterium]